MPKARRRQPKHVPDSRRKQFIEAVQIDSSAIHKPLK
jgi:hypothetical protein